MQIENRKKCFDELFDGNDICPGNHISPRKLFSLFAQISTMNEEEFKKKKSIARKFGYAFSGMFIPYKTEISIRIQTGFAIAVAMLGIYFHISRNDWLWIIIAAALVLITETLNTAIEKLVDLVSPGYNELAGKVKDIAAGAVFMAALISILIGVLVFLPYL